MDDTNWAGPSFKRIMDQGRQFSTYPITSDNRIVGAYSVLNPPSADRLEEIERNDNGTKYNFDGKKYVRPHPYNIQ